MIGAAGDHHYQVPVSVLHRVLLRPARGSVAVPRIEYLKVWRLHLAFARLRDGERKLREVAQAVGYESEAAFSKAFRNTFGAPPGTWRRGNESR